MLPRKIHAHDSSARTFNRGDNSNWSAATTKFGQFVDEAIIDTCGTYSYTNVSVIARGSSSNDDAKSGNYVSIAVVPAAKIADSTTDVVVAVWYDPYKKTIWYSYLTNPLDTTNINSTTHKNPNWSVPTPILNGTAGGYCKIAVDDSGHIHIATYSRADSGSLIYTYLASYDSTPKSCVVDSYGITGQYLTIDFARNAADGQQVPYIGYYMASQALPKIAYLSDLTSADENTWSPKAGADSESMFTGAWETIMVPSQSIIMQEKISVGVYRDKNTGVIKEIPVQASPSAGATDGKAGGNGTSNPILGYGVTIGTKGYIETAQMR